MALDPARRRYRTKLLTLRLRPEFQRLRGGVRWSGAAFVLEGKPRTIVLGTPAARFGFTITKKIGMAHERNRMRRRLSHALRTIETPPALEGWDMVVVARRAALDVPFDSLINDFRTALARLARTPISPMRKSPTSAPEKP